MLERHADEIGRARRTVRELKHAIALPLLALIQRYDDILGFLVYEHRVSMGERALAWGCQRQVYATLTGRTLPTS